MIIISHRANLYEINKQTENNPYQILKCLSDGFDVEIDVWNLENEYFLGHDEPQYKIDSKFLENKNLWCHAKNIQSLREMKSNKKINCFWHQEDDYTLTSKNFIWVYPNKPLIEGCVAVMPEISSYSLEDLKKCYAICTDKPIYYKNLLNGVL